MIIYIIYDIISYNIWYNIIYNLSDVFFDAVIKEESYIIKLHHKYFDRFCSVRLGQWLLGLELLGLGWPDWNLLLG